MEILKLEINNFLTIGEATLGLDNKGLVLLRGENRDDPSASSNGSGKSSIPDAICWALYGETARGASGDSVVNKVAKKDCRVRITLRDGDTVYCITRYRKHKEYKNVTLIHSWTYGEWEGAGVSGVEMHKATEKETQLAINEIMGCTPEVFMASIYAGQEAMPDLPKMTDKQLKALIEQAAGVERLEKAYEISRSKAMVAKSQLEGTASLLVRAESDRASTFEKLRDSAGKYREFELGREGRSVELLSQAAALEAKIPELEDSIIGADAESARDKLKEIATTLSKHRELTATHGELLRDVRTAENEVTRTQTEYDRECKTLRTIKAAIDNAPEEMKKPCGECGKPHTEDELAEYIEHQTKRLREQADVVRSSQAKLSMTKSVLEMAQKNLSEFELPDVSAIAEEQRKLQGVIDTVASVEVKVERVKDQVKVLRDKAETVKTETNPYKETVRLLNEEVKEGDKLIEKLKIERAEKEHAYEVAQSVVAVFGPAGVRAHILDTVTPFLNDRTGDYLGALSDGSITAVWSTLGETKAGDLREKFNIEVVNDKGAEDFIGLSGGEKRKVRLATMLALQDLVASRAVKPINLWIGDEVDDALDVAGLERLMGIMERKARERGTVLIISHNDLSDWIDDQTVVIKDGGVSRVEGVLCA